jgi:tetratricopeptide (TPR) repeat protein
MLKNRVVLIVVIIILVAAIFSLPKVVVDNEQDEIAEEAVSNSEGSEDTAGNVPPQNDMHVVEIPDSVQQRLDVFRKNFYSAESKENSAIFADSLASVYQEIGKLDSAAKYTELAEEDYEVIADSYYEAFTFAVDAGKANTLGKKARDYFEKVLEEDASRLDVKTKIAMTYVSSQNPMKGILMLREVVEQDPENEEALFNLGVLSIQSGQYGKAIERFERLLSLNEANEQAQFYLGLSYFNNGESGKAREVLEKIKNTSSDEQIKAAAESYLNELN